MQTTDYKSSELAKEYSKKPITHRYIIFPALLETLGDIKNKKILDIGCGFGDFSRMLAAKGAEVTGIDNSKAMIELSKKNEAANLRFYLQDASNLSDFGSKTFDFVVMNMVLLNISEKKILERIFKEISRVSKDSGDFIFTDINPIYWMKEKSLTETHFFSGNGLSEDFSYFKDGSFLKSESTLSDGSKINFTDAHWTLETITTLLNNAGMFIYKIKEPQPIPNSPSILDNYKEPIFILFQCRKFKS